MIVYAIIERESGQKVAEEYGQNIGAMGLESLDQYLQEIEVTPISEFMHEDMVTLEQALVVAQPAEKAVLQRRLKAMRRRPDWHDPHEGLRTVRALIPQLPHDGRHDGVLSDLKIYEQILNEAVHTQDRFRINVLTRD